MYSIEDIKQNKLIIKADETFAQSRQKMTKFFQKNQGRNFVNFLIKENDDFIKTYLNALVKEYFGDFAPETDAFSLSILATNKYAQGLVSVDSAFEILIVYKNIRGYNIKNFIKTFIELLHSSSINLQIKTIEIDELFLHYKDDIKVKSEISWVRYICGSKSIYRMAKTQIQLAKEHNKLEFLSYHLKPFLPFENIKYLEQEPNLKTGFGGSDEIWHLNCILNCLDSEISVRTQALKFMDEKEISEFNLNTDFLMSLKSALNLTKNSDTFIASSVDEVTNLMQTKSKKTQDTDSIISQKMLSNMNNIAIYSRFLAASLCRPMFKSELNFTQRRAARLSNGLYQIQNIVYTPTHKKPVGINKLIKELLSLKDIDYKFDISTIFYIKRAIITKPELEKAIMNFKKIFARNNTYCILKALLDAQIIQILVKPMEHISQLAQYDGYHNFTVDEHSVLSVKYLENIKDKFIKNLYSELCAEGRIMLKMVTLMHDVGKGVSGDHSVVGSNIFRAYANKLELSAKATNTGVTLIKYHTLMSNIANREDIYSQRVIFGFISKLAEKQNLKLLYILSYCVINATSETLYTPYTAKLLKKLYDLSYESFDDETLLDEATRRVKKEHSIKRNEEFERLDDAIKAKLLKISSNLLFAKHSVVDIINIAKRAYNLTSTQMDVLNNQSLSVKIISNENLNLSALLAVLAAYDLAYMEIYELFDDKFFIRLEFNKNVKNSELLNLKVKADEALHSNENIKLESPKISRDEITFDINHSNEYARLNINAKDQRGLMAYVMSVFGKMNFKITSAKVQTIKNRTRNLFLIEKNDELCYNAEKILKLLISE
ncbi:HD domain-containing protein [Campylobacter sp. RM6883]|uniref:HD domain-containing protein n=1 Tax=Campylobacter californiensis TaxID=1032243 RepID=UPI00145285B9|nr:HD domain-containing protein [Campylobacter sp. RM6914]MBE2984862.1 HD domain-containing protein [Campylobacter sp. RM6883]MBE2995362.1 HD domain-containing protein [Campylobacter sp. RM6913]QCD51145.1 [protein-PII] uridylyltransferase [Campylobacter sp. RM6914]